MRAFVFTALLLLVTSCATPSYVLHYRENVRLSNFISPPKENASIPNASGVALLYDRHPWTLIEEKMEDDTVWVHYAIVLKNSTSRKAALQSRRVRLESEGLPAVNAIYDPKDEIGRSYPLEPNTYHRMTAKFLLPKEYVEHHADSSEPIYLVAPVDEQELRLKLWLWAE